MRKRKLILLVVSRFLLAGILASAVELGSSEIGNLREYPALEPTPAGAFLAGTLGGWEGVAGWVAGYTIVRLGVLGSSSPGRVVAIAIAFVLLGITGYLVFRLGGRLGRGFPDLRSAVGLLCGAALGGTLTAAAFLPINPESFAWGGFVVSIGSNLASVLFFAPPVMLLADRFARPLLAPLPFECFHPLPFPRNLEIQPTKSPVPLGGRLALVGLALLAATALAVALTQQTQLAGGWPLLGYLGVILWSALSYGLRGGLLASSIGALLYLSARTFLDREIPEDPGLYAAGLYTEFVIFWLVALVLGAGRENEVRMRLQMRRRDKMSDLLQAAVAAAEAYRIVETEMVRLLPDAGGALFELSDGNLLKEVAVWGEEPRAKRAFTPEDCWALRRGEVHRGGDGHSAAVCPHLEGNVEPYVCIPLLAQGEAIGVLSVAQDEPDLNYLRAIARTISLALGNIRAHQELREQSIRDPLTGLVNRRYLVEQMELEVARATRNKTTIGLVILDIDHFKRFNDTYGHEAGDEVLREVGHFLSSHARQGDVVCRYGGEEFVLVLPGAPLQIVERRADELREGVKQLRPRLAGQSLGHVSASFGGASWPLHGQTWRSVLELADHALYAAKRSGRDRVVMAEVSEIIARDPEIALRS